MPLRPIRDQSRRQGGRYGGDDLAGRDDASTGRQAKESSMTLDPLNRAANAQRLRQVHGSGRSNARQKPAHPAPRPGQPGATDRDPERGVDQRCLGHGAMDRVLDQHRQQADQRPIVLEAVSPQGVGQRPAQVADQGQPAEADRGRTRIASARLRTGSLTPRRLACQKTSASRSRSRQKDRCAGVSPSTCSRSRDQQAGSRYSVTCGRAARRRSRAASSPSIGAIPMLSAIRRQRRRVRSRRVWWHPHRSEKPFRRKKPAQPPGWP